VRHQLRDRHVVQHVPAGATASRLIGIDAGVGSPSWTSRTITDQSPRGPRRREVARARQDHAGL